MDALKKCLEDLTQEARNSGEGEYKCLMKFLNDQVDSVDRGELNKELLIICEQFCLTALFIKSRLMNLKEEA